MRILSKEEFEKQQFDLYMEIENGAIFIYPTDTIYGIGCSAENDLSVKRIRELKERKDTPFSVIAPSKSWIRDHCYVNHAGEEWLEKLPAPLTLILKRRGNSIAQSVAPEVSTLGVRMPKNWFLEHVQDIGIPIVTTSVNKHGEQYMTSLEDLDDDFKKAVSFVIYEGEKNGRPSQLVDLSDSFKIIQR